MSEACFTAADILLPAAGVPLDPWACIAVDQFTSQPESWPVSYTHLLFWCRTVSVIPTAV